MEKLEDFENIKLSLKVSSTNAVKVLHKIIFEEEGDRGNRKRLRQFCGFKYESTDDIKFKNKTVFVSANFSLNELITACNILHIKYEGSKSEVVERILSALNDLNVLNKNIIVDDYESDDDDITNQKTLGMAANSENKSVSNLLENNGTDFNNSFNQCQNDIRNLNGDLSSKSESKVGNSNSFSKYSMNFSDIEATMRPYDGTVYHSIQKWISDFEDVSELFELSDLHKLIFAKRLLTGKAKLFIQGESGMHTWNELKTLLINEFADECNSADLHAALAKRRMRENESVEEYFLRMKEIASRGNIEEPALIQHVINGIADLPFNKAILYGCKSFREFREKLKIYTKIKNDSQRCQSRQIKPISKPKHNHNDEIRCFNCGAKGHKSQACFFKEKGMKCFRCNQFGHKSYDCPTKTEARTSHMTLKNDVSTVMKDIQICNLTFSALIDTGSQVTLIRKCVYECIGSPKLNDSFHALTGLGNNKIQPLGYFTGKIAIDELELTTNINVVDNSTMSFNVIIGMDVIKQGNLIISKDGITITKCIEVKPIEEQLIFNISVAQDFECDIGPDISKRHRITIEQLVSNYKPAKTKSTNVEMSIQVKDEIPISHRPRRLPFVERDIVDQQVQEWIAERIVEPCSSEYSSQVVVVKKKDGNSRVCIDYRKLNRKIFRDQYPLPLIEDLLDKLQNAQVFSTIDLKNGFFHVNVEKNSRHYTSFVTHNGQFQFLRVPFGLCKSPAVFQRFINSVFKELIMKGHVLPYMDDLIIPAKDEEEGVERLKSVFSTARDYGLEINFKKCQFLSRRIEFLGHIIENGKLFPSPHKTSAVINYPEPRSLKEVQSFLGLAGYFRKFISNYSLIAKPLSDMLKKSNTFQFQENERNAFNHLKQILCDKPVIGIYNQQSETEIHTDASIDGYGCVLMQKSMTDNCFHPIYYMSRKTSDAERKYSSYELEVLAIIEALKKFRVYLLGIHFKIITDCNAFKMTMSKRDLSTRIARWALLLEDFNYDIEHRSGSRMSHVDALSRSPVMTITEDSILLKLKNAQEQDDEIKTIKEVLKTKSYNDYYVKGNLLYKFIDGIEVLVVPELMQMEIIREAHDRGHFGYKRTEEIIKQNFYIPKMKQKIEKCISNCVPCILINRKAGKQEGHLHPLPKEETPLCTYHVDHLGPLTSTNKNYKYIFAVMDSFTKFVWLYPTKSTSTDEVITKLENQKSMFGNPSQIISDRGTAFTSKEFEDYCVKQNIQHYLITTGLPRANGQVERLNSIIISVLSKLSIEDPSKWYNHVHEVQQAINSTFQRSIKTTPFELLFGTKMKFRTNLTITELLNAEIQSSFNTDRDDLRKEAKKQILKVQEENRKTYNLRRRNPNKYKLDDLVAIKRTQFGSNLKLKPKFLGPYKIVKIKKNDTYDVEKIGFAEGSMKTSTCAEFMKPWTVPNTAVT